MRLALLLAGLLGWASSGHTQAIATLGGNGSVFAFADYATTDSNATIDGVIDVPAVGLIAIQCKNSGANSANYTIYGAIDTAIGSILVNDVAITAGTTAAFTASVFYRYYTIQARSTVPGNSTTLKCRIGTK